MSRQPNMSVAATMPHATNRDALESLEGFSKLPARVRESYQPLDLSATDEARNDRVSRAEKMGRRDSRLALRNIFSRPKNMRQTEELNAPQFAIPEVAENTTQGIPYYTLPPGKPIVWTESTNNQPLLTTIEEPELKPLQPVVTEPTKRKGGNTKTQGRQDAVSWDLPPMHKAYAQAVRYSTLSTATVPADLILRNQEKKAAEASSAVDSTGKTEDKSKSKKKHRHAKSSSDYEWTSKTYILVTAGYLLEYATEGPFDRLPEKVLRLGKNSAAFASDLIPGRHWVLQVSSAIGSDGVASTDTAKSFLSRLPFRGHAEKRSAANMLLVFDNAEIMNDWLVTLRRAVQAQGGKQTVSETGKPVAENENSAPLRGQPSQRTLKEYDRYSRSIGDGQSWEQDFVRRKSDASDAQSDSARNQSLDEMSATNSFVSHDGQQLDNLRDSSNRLSCISSGQRTMITSEDSSPACSPTAETFSSASVSDDPPRRHQDTVGADGRLRPNAGAINDRRKSLQTMSPFLDVRQGQAAQRPQSTMIGTISSGPLSEMGVPSSHPQPQPQLPNFSVPQKSSRRFSSLRPLQQENTPLSLPSRMDFHTPSRNMSKRPPTALRISRPLSMVSDQPSPRENIPERPATRHGESTKSSEPDVEPPLPPLPTMRPKSERQISETSSYTSPRTPPKTPGSRIISPRRLSSMGALRQKQGGLSPPSQGGLFEAPRLRSLHPPQVRAQDPDRCHSSVDLYDRTHFSSSLGSRVPKRSSMLPYVPDQQHYQPPSAPPPSGPLPAVPATGGNRLSLRPEANSHGLQSRRSMPHLADGPPPAPPPTCALPPIPQRPPNMI